MQDAEKAFGFSMLLGLGNRFPITEIIIKLGSWHSEPHIHSWFVKHNQSNKDDGKKYFVPRSLLEFLRATCNDVLFAMEKGPYLLPITNDQRAGYGVAYQFSLQETILVLDKALELPEEWLFTYSS